MIRNVIFDVGGVLVQSVTADWMIPPHFQAVLGEDFLRTRLQDFRRAKPAAHEYIPDLHHLTSVAEEEALLVQYYRCILNGQLHMDISEEGIRALAADQCRYDGRYLVYSDVFPLLRRFHGCFRTGILSDAPPSLKRILEHIRILGNADAGDVSPIDAAVFSFQLGKMKPDPAMYAAILEKLDAKPEETLFVDDTPGNVAGAAALGIHAVQMRRTVPAGFYEAPLWDGPIVRDLDELFTYCENH